MYYPKGTATSDNGPLLCERIENAIHLDICILAVVHEQGVCGLDHYF